MSLSRHTSVKYKSIAIAWEGWRFKFLFLIFLIFTPFHFYSLLVLSRVYFCFSGEALIGVVALKVEEKCYAIENIAVNPEFFNQGFGTMMLTSLKKHPERFGLEGLCGYTIVHEDNIRSLRAFEKSGFKKSKNVVVCPLNFVEMVSEDRKSVV